MQAGPDDLIRNNATIMALAPHLSPGFMVVPPTVRFPHGAIAHPEMGLCALVIVTGVVLFDERDHRWYGENPIDPEKISGDAIVELATAAKAPMDRICCLVWLTNAFTTTDVPGICVSTDPLMAAAMAERMLNHIANGTDTPLNPWLATYVVGASGPKGPPSEPVQRISALVEHTLSVMFGDSEAVISGTTLSPADFADPRFLLPAVLVAAAEDWAVTRHAMRPNLRKPTGHPGFVLQMTPDPGALLGYRVDGVSPSTQFLVHGPVVSVIRRFRFDGEFTFEDLVGQFARYLQKNGFDSSVVDDYEVRLATSG